jgi:hypothetical protein
MPKPKGKIPRINYIKVDQIEFKEQDWRGIENAYGHALSPEVRTRIGVATNDFVRGASAENNGRMADALARSRALHRRAKDLKTAIEKRPTGDQIREYVDDEIALSHAIQNATKYRESLGMRMAPLAERKYVTEFLHELDRFIKACERTIQEFDYMSRYNYWPDGAAWEKWVRNLTRLADDNRLPTGVRKDVDKNWRGKASQFLELIRAIHDHLPANFIPKRSKDALATAITRARSRPKTNLPSKKTPTAL